MILLLIGGILFLLYAIVVIYYWQSWKDIPVYSGAKESSLTISVIISARNEEENIGNLLQALAQQTYPAHLFEVIVVNDHSEDNTAVIVNQFPFARLISLQEGKINSYKKKALETGIKEAKHELVVATDADCIPHKNWLQTLASFKEENDAVFIAAPVRMTADHSLLQLFQQMDFMILQTITGAVVSKQLLTMCNGANVAYTKKAFEEVSGFAGISDIASGDDMLLMYKIAKQYPGKVYYIKSPGVIVSTAAEKTWTSFFNQRIRWASKANRYNDKRLLPVLLLVYLFNLLFPVLLVAGFFNTRYWWELLVLFLAKTLVEFPLFSSGSRFFGISGNPFLFLLFQPLHILYTVISGLFGQFGTYQWKGRKVK
ncbi:MAG TPA: glycosyltransferase [Chitinophagaceae bacterium]|nr:glycosyltransferase [Chitinophagaceae bacterium]